MSVGNQGTERHFVVRSPFQVLVLPYRRRGDGTYEFAVFCRSDGTYWQRIAGGGEDDETPIEAARREAFEEGGVLGASPYLALDTISAIPGFGFRDSHLWESDLYIIPEYAFGVDISGQELKLSSEHTEVQWLSFMEAKHTLRYDGNRVVLRELHQKIQGISPQDTYP